jgi:hypothetical protein
LDPLSGRQSDESRRNDTAERDQRQAGEIYLVFGRSVENAAERALNSQAVAKGARRQD